MSTSGQCDASIRETHLDANVTTDMLSFSNSYSIPYRKDRTNHGGGILAYLNLSLLYIYIPEGLILRYSVMLNQFGSMFLIGIFYSPTT